MIRDTNRWQSLQGGTKRVVAESFEVGKEQAMTAEIKEK